MKKSVYLIGYNHDISKVAENIKNELKKIGRNADIFMPFTSSEQKLKETFASGNYHLIIEEAISNHNKTLLESDIAIGIGLTDSGNDGYFAVKINADLTSNFSSGAIIIAPKEQSKLIAPIIESKRGDVIYTSESGEVTKEMLDAILNFETSKISVKMFEAQMIDRAKKHKQRIVLPEGTCERVIRASEVLAKRGICHPILLGDEQEIKKTASKLNITLDGVTIEPIETNEKFNDYANTLYELRKEKGLTPEQARDLMKDCGYFGTMMIYKDDADGMVSGAEHTTAHTIRPALQFVKTKKGVSVVSGSFVMVFKHKYFVFADCGVTPEPTTDQLAEIAISSIETAKAVGLEPKISFMSFSTGDSSKDKTVEITKEAMNKAKELAKSLGIDVEIDGPLQFDAAIDEEVAKHKLPNSKVAGKANIFIFPDLNCGNNCYKAVQRAAEESLALGPILQGLKKPVNDLSRGCTVPDIINLVSITAMQAQINKGLV
ncbi:MAG: Phosphate acetyltransferase [Alphaproteobacteria bacterium ADurb.Bin438]|nr:MAG: Phosphate acetyltransferase [Alphaproteobacteria bacterium ADurb.Bin438]